MKNLDGQSVFVKFDFQNYFLGNFIVNLCFRFNGSYYAGWGNCRKLNCFNYSFLGQFMV